MRRRRGRFPVINGNRMLRALGAAVTLALALAFQPLGAGQPGEVDWAKINPAFAKAAFVKSKAACVSCHEDAMKTYAGTTHGGTFQHGAKGALQSLDCEACHGPRSLHVANPDASLKMSAKQYTVACQQCHQGGNRMHWRNSRHQSADVQCTSCHTIMKRQSDKALLSKGTEAAVCYTCHTEVKGEMMRASHHPVREGKMSCSSCHNTHGSVGKSLLKGATLNETCFNCHQDKRGPFLWEHAPVRENCGNCHQAHGSNNPNLLESKGAFGCLQCHSYGGHINLPRYNRTSNPYGQGCVNCHTTQHGSSHPSGAKFTR